MFLLEMQAEIFRSWMKMTEAGLKAFSDAGGAFAGGADEVRSSRPTYGTERAIAPVFPFFPANSKNSPANASRDHSVFPVFNPMEFWSQFMPQALGRGDDWARPVLSLTLAWPMPGTFSSQGRAAPEATGPAVTFRSSSGFASATVSAPIEMPSRTPAHALPWLWPWTMMTGR